MQAHIGSSVSDQAMVDYFWSTLKSGQVIPGYGHGVLRQPDPRFTTLIGWANTKKEFNQDPLFQLVKWRRPNVRLGFHFHLVYCT